MKKYLHIGVTTLFVLMAAPASAACSYNNSSGQYRCNMPASTYQVSDEGPPPELLIFGGLAVLIISAIMTAVSGSSNGARNLPKELRPSESVEHYDQEAARTRALARKLDADASLAETQLRMSLKQDELKEFESFLREKNSSRRRR